MRRLIMVLVPVGAALAAGAWLVSGCGCRQHGVSAVNVTPEMACLELRGGVPGRAESSIGLCESVWLLGRNGCSEALHLPAMPPDGSEVPLDVAPGVDFEFRVAEHMESGKTYTISASVGTTPVIISFRISEDEL